MIANLFLGFGFTATIWALESFSLAQILAVRFLMVGAAGLVWAFFNKPGYLREYLPLTFWPALFLVMEILFQVWGLEKTSATKSGFLTVTYIVMVPVLESLFLKQNIRWSHWICVGIALAGSLLMMQLDSFTLELGDILILISALGASLHLISVDRLGKTKENLFFANTMQSLWGAIWFVPFALFQRTPWPVVISTKSWIGLISLTFGTTFLAFYFQMRAQRHLTPSILSLLLLLESPMAAVFGLFFLNESLMPVQWLGCALVLMSAVGVTIYNLKYEAPS
jgi:drug/metabolite transporter (DMT)-like permease